MFAPSSCTHFHSLSVCYAMSLLCARALQNLFTLLAIVSVCRCSHIQTSIWVFCTRDIDSRSIIQSNAESTTKYMWYCCTLDSYFIESTKMSHLYVKFMRPNWSRMENWKLSIIFNISTAIFEILSFFRFFFSHFSIDFDRKQTFVTHMHTAYISIVVFSQRLFNWEHKTILLDSGFFYDTQNIVIAIDKMRCCANSNCIQARRPNTSEKKTIMANT